jgi:hypothetical protein
MTVHLEIDWSLEETRIGKAPERITKHEPDQEPQRRLLWLERETKKEINKMARRKKKKTKPRLAYRINRVLAIKPGRIRTDKQNWKNQDKNEQAS